MRECEGELEGKITEGEEEVRKNEEEEEEEDFECRSLQNLRSECHDAPKLDAVVHQYTKILSHFFRILSTWR